MQCVIMIMIKKRFQMPADTIGNNDGFFDYGRAMHIVYIHFYLFVGGYDLAAECENQLAADQPIENIQYFISPRENRLQLRVHRTDQGKFKETRGYNREKGNVEIVINQPDFFNSMLFGNIYHADVIGREKRADSEVIEVILNLKMNRRETVYRKVIRVTVSLFVF